MSATAIFGDMAAEVQKWGDAGSEFMRRAAEAREEQMSYFRAAMDELRLHREADAARAAHQERLLRGEVAALRRQSEDAGLGDLCARYREAYAVLCARADGEPLPPQFQAAAEAVRAWFNAAFPGMRAVTMVVR